MNAVSNNTYKMKSFSQFISEATSASVQAKRLGLVGDGHGGWYNRATGEFEAKTVGGQLKYYNKNQIIGAKDPKQTEFEKNIPLGSSYPEQPIQQQVPVEQQPQEEIPPEEPTTTVPPIPKTKGTLVIAFGRFNPPTVGHQQLIDTASMVAMEDGADYIVAPSRSQDKNKNPLDPDTKISFMRMMFPDHSERIVNDPNFKTIFDVLKKAHNDGYTNIKVVCGSDRIKEFERLSNEYNGKLYQFDMIDIIPSGDIDPDGNKSIEGLSSSRLRLAAVEGDFITFRSGLPAEVKNKEALKLFDFVRQGMGIEEIQQEGYYTWKIAPKLDQQSLRENYISQNIFKLGTFVENLNTGLNGKIIRRGTNYLICVTEDEIMFKSWIKDVKESFSEKSKKTNTISIINKNKKK